MADIILTVLFWIIVAAIVLFLVLDFRRMYYVKTGDLDPDTIPRVKLTNYNYYVLILVIVMNLVALLKEVIN